MKYLPKTFEVCIDMYLYTSGLMPAQNDNGNCGLFAPNACWHNTQNDVLIPKKLFFSLETNDTLLTQELHWICDVVQLVQMGSRNKNLSISFVFIMSTNAAKCTMILPLERRINAVIS